MVIMRLLKITKAVAVLLLMSMALSLGVFAAEGQTRIYSEDQFNAAPGDEITVPVYIENNPGIACFMVSILYDKNVIEPVADSEVVGDIAPMVMANPSYMNKPETRVGCIHYDNFTGDGLLFTYKFRVKEGAPAGKTTLTFSTVPDSTAHLNEKYLAEPVDCAGATSTVAVSGGSVTDPTSNPTSNPTANPTGAPAFELKANADSLPYMAPANDTSFAPDRAATRYEVIEALYELLDFTNLEDTNLFTDVDEAHRAMVNAFAQTPIIDGYPDGTFGGANNITRAEFVKVLSVAAKVDIDTALKAEFSDIAADHWANAYIASFVKAGYIYGYPDGTFMPESNITRAEVVAIINRVTGMKKADGAAQRFDDLQPGHWAYGDVSAAAK